MPTEGTNSGTTAAATTTTNTFAQVPNLFTMVSAPITGPAKGPKSPDFKFERGGVFFSKLMAPWRSVEWTKEERSSLLDRLSTYIPGSQDVPQARVLLLGPVGAGKSSFISSALSLFDGRVTTRAMVGCNAVSSFTKKLQSFPLRAQDSGEGRSTALVLYDMMGFGNVVTNGPTLHDMLSVIRGHAPEGYEFRADQALSSDTEGYIKCPSLREQMHCVAFVLDASKVCYGSYSKAITDTLQELRLNISDMGLHQVVLLTHIDQICPATAEDTSEVYKSVFVRDMICKAAELVGISASSVVPVKNYWCELDLDLNSDVLLLRALDHILQYTELQFTAKRESSTSDDH